MAHDASQNNPLKESVMSVVGLVLLLVIIAGIAISAWLRPAGEHQPAEAETQSVVAAETQETNQEPATQAADAQNDKQPAATQTSETNENTEAQPQDEAQLADDSKKTAQ